MANHGYLVYDEVIGYGDMLDALSSINQDIFGCCFLLESDGDSVNLSIGDYIGHIFWLGFTSMGLPCIEFRHPGLVLWSWWVENVILLELQRRFGGYILDDGVDDIVVIDSLMNSQFKNWMSTKGVTQRLVHLGDLDKLRKMGRYDVIEKLKLDI